MSFYAGQTFLYPLNESVKAHLWIVATDPNADDLVAIVNLTTLREAQDQTVVFRKAEHVFLKHDTCACYGQAEVVPCSKIQQFLADGSAKIHSDISNQLLAELQEGFLASDFTKNRVRQFVKDYRTERRARNAGPAATPKSSDV